MEILNTNRLILRTIEKNDYTALYEKIFSDYDVVKNTFGATMFSKEETFDFLYKNANSNSLLGLSVLEEKESQNIIGMAGVIKCNYLDTTDYEIGFILEKKSWRKGYAKEIGLAQINQIKNEFEQTRALALVDPLNEASIKSIKNLGLVKIDEVNTSRGLREVFSISFKKSA